MAGPRRQGTASILIVTHLPKKMLAARQWPLIATVAPTDSLLMAPRIGTLLQDSIYWTRASGGLSLGHMSVPSLPGMLGRQKQQMSSHVC